MGWLYLSTPLNTAFLWILQLVLVLAPLWALRALLRQRSFARRGADELAESLGLADSGGYRITLRPERRELLFQRQFPLPGDERKGDVARVTFEFRRSGLHSDGGFVVVERRVDAHGALEAEQVGRLEGPTLARLDPLRGLLRRWSAHLHIVRLSRKDVTFVYRKRLFTDRGLPRSVLEQQLPELRAAVAALHAAFYLPEGAVAPAQRALGTMNSDGYRGSAAATWYVEGSVDRGPQTARQVAEALADGRLSLSSRVSLAPGAPFEPIALLEEPTAVLGDRRPLKHAAYRPKLGRRLLDQLAIGWFDLAQRRELTLVCWLLCYFTVLGCRIGLPEIDLAQRSLSWIPAPGVVVGTRVDKTAHTRCDKTSSSSSKCRTHYTYAPVVRYAFDHAGRSYQGERLTFDAIFFYQEAEARAYLRAYPLRRKVTVYHDADQPSMSSLHRGVPATGLALLLLFAVEAALFGALGAIGPLRRWREERRGVPSSGL